VVETEVLAEVGGSTGLSDLFESYLIPRWHMPLQVPGKWDRQWRSSNESESFYN
jgi:hypothetical protein